MVNGLIQHCAATISRQLPVGTKSFLIFLVYFGKVPGLRFSLSRDKPKISKIVLLRLITDLRIGIFRSKYHFWKKSYIGQYIIFNIDRFMLTYSECNILNLISLNAVWSQSLDFISDHIKWGASSRWSSSPNSAWGSKETTVIRQMCSILCQPKD